MAKSRRRNAGNLRGRGAGTINRQAPTVALIEVPCKPVRINWGTSTDGEYEYELSAPDQAPPLAAITHYRWEMVSTVEVRWNPPNNARSIYVKQFQGTWIARSDFESMTLHTTAGMYIPCTFDDSGKPVNPDKWIPPATTVTWHCRGVL
jgi:hypothetical protein